MRTITSNSQNASAREWKKPLRENKEDIEKEAYTSEESESGEVDPVLGACSNSIHDRELGALKKDGKKEQEVQKKTPRRRGIEKSKDKKNSPGFQNQYY